MLWFGILLCIFGLFALFAHLRRWPAGGDSGFIRGLRRIGLARDEVYYRKQRLIVAIGFLVVGSLEIAAAIF